MDAKKVRLTLTDDRVVDFETARWAIPADRIEFERRYGMSSQKISADKANAKEEWALFFIFRAAAREVPEFASMAFDDWIELLEDYEYVGEEEEVVESVPPTVEGAPTG